MTPEVRFLRWKDPSRVSEDDYHDSVVDEELRDAIEYARHAPFRPGGNYLGPMGMLPAAPHNAPSELYDLWVMHANFNLSGPVVDCVKGVPGVEILHVWTRYRAWLGVGKLFGAEAVHQEVRRALSSLFGGSDPAGEMVADAASTAPSWAVVRDPFGQLKTVTGCSDREVLDRLSPSDSLVRSSWL